MKRQIIVSVVVISAFAIITSVSTLIVKADTIMTMDAIAGTWYGNMHFSTVNSVQRVKLIIPSGCEPGNVCGSLLNYPVQCTWEITYDGFNGQSYEYHFSNTLMGSCPAGSSGTLTLLPDGQLYRIHTTPLFTSTGILNHLPSANE